MKQICHTTNVDVLLELTRYIHHTGTTPLAPIDSAKRGGRKNYGGFLFK